MKPNIKCLNCNRINNKLTNQFTSAYKISDYLYNYSQLCRYCKHKLEYIKIKLDPFNTFSIKFVNIYEHTKVLELLIIYFNNHALGNVDEILELSPKGMITTEIELAIKLI